MFKSNLSFFKTSDNLKKPPLETDPQETQPLATRIFKGFMEKVTEKAASISQKTQEATNTVSNWKNFLIFFIIGCVLLMLAFTFLPILALAPQKFSSLFTLGSLCILFSLGVLKGFNNLAKSLCNKEKWTYTAAYIFSVGGTLYFALIQKSYIFVLIASGIQVYKTIFFY